MLFHREKQTYTPFIASPADNMKISTSAIDRNDFGFVRDLIYAKCGIVLRPGKEAMVRARLDKRMRELDISNVKKYVNLVRGEKDGSELLHLIDAITTNVTDFFREPRHFTFLEEQIRRWTIEGRRRLRFWSAGCASGEEPYSIAMTALDCTSGMNSDIQVIATDISTKVIREAKRGEYNEIRMRSVPPRKRRRYFGHQSTVEGTVWIVKDVLRRIVDFGSINLVSRPYPMSGSLDVIFCRNVLIYFDNDFRRSVCREMFRLLRSGGYLFVGHAELPADSSAYGKMVIPSVYRKQ